MSDLWLAVIFLIEAIVTVVVIVVASKTSYKNGVNSANKLNESLVDIYNRKIDELKELPTNNKDYSPEYVAGWNECVETFKLRKEK